MEKSAPNNGSECGKRSILNCHAINHLVKILSLSGTFFLSFYADKSKKVFRVVCFVWYIANDFSFFCLLFGVSFKQKLWTEDKGSSYRILELFIAACLLKIALVSSVFPTANRIVYVRCCYPATAVQFAFLHFIRANQLSNKSKTRDHARV